MRIIFLLVFYLHVSTYFLFSAKDIDGCQTFPVDQEMQKQGEIKMIVQS